MMARSEAKKLGRTVGWIGLFFCGSIAGVSFLLLYAVVLVPWLEERATAAWTETPCTILENKIETHDIPRGNSRVGKRRRHDATSGFSPEVRFEYMVKGMKYQSDRFSFSKMLHNTREEAEAVSAHYPLASEQICFVDPTDANEAVLARDQAPLNFVLLAVGFLFFTLGAAGALASLWLALRRS